MNDSTIDTKNQQAQGGAQWDIGGTLNINSGGLLNVEAGGDFTTWKGAVVHNTRIRVTLAQLNAGLTLLAATTGFKFRLVGVKLIAIGGAVAGATSVDISATQGAVGVKLVSAAVAALTQSTVVGESTANVTVLADGASFVLNDSATAITIGKTGSAATTATAVDVILSFTAEAG